MPESPSLAFFLSIKDKRTDFGLQLGGGFKILNTILLDFRYGVGLTDIYNSNPDDPQAAPKSKNRTLQFSLGFQIH